MGAFECLYMRYRRQELPVVLWLPLLAVRVLCAFVFQYVSPDVDYIERRP